jgi:hypothetical protein
MKMSKTFFLKIGFGFLGLAILAGFYSLKNESVSAQTKKTKAAAGKTKSLCQPSEQVIWNCPTTNNKTASICASKDLAEEKGYLQYRFGRQGKIELEFPKDRKDSAQKFKYTRYTRPLVTMLTLKFETGGVVYEIHDDDNSEEKPPVRAASIDIADGAKNFSVVGKQPPTGSLMKLEGIVPRDEEN